MNKFLLLRKNIKLIADFTRGFEEMDAMLKDGQEVENYIAELRQKAAGMEKEIADAAEQAKAMVNDARKQAEAIVQQAEAVRKSAVDEALQSGSMSKTARAEADRMIADANKAVFDFMAEKKQIMEEAARRAEAAEHRLVELDNEIAAAEQRLRNVKQQMADLSAALTV